MPNDPARSEMTQYAKLRPFQKEGVRFLLAANHRLLCDDAGLGKSAQALVAADTLDLKRVLILGPAIAGASWPIEVAKWWPGATYGDENSALPLKALFKVMFTSYGKVAASDSLRHYYASVAWDLVVLDEGQYLKSADAQRTRAAYGDPGIASLGVIGKAKRGWVLSGTLCPNHAGEAYPHLRRLFPAALARLPFCGTRVPEQYEFEERYCVVRDTQYGRVIDGSKNMRELRDGLAGVLLRRRKEDVLPELPPLEWLVAPCPIAATAQQELAGAVEADAPEHNFEDWLMSDEPLAKTARERLGQAKVASVCEWIKDRIASGDKKIIVFAVHRSVMDAIGHGLFARKIGHVRIDGGTPTGVRGRAVEAFQTDDKVQVFLGQIVAAGTAITLTAARTVLFAEYVGTPGVNVQAAARAHRMGQRNAVQAYLATAPGTLDERTAATAQRRAEQLAELFDAPSP